jgi:emfourin
VKIKVERSGGLAAISFSNEMDSKDLPSVLAATAKNIMRNQKSSSLPKKSAPMGSADHYIYRISFQNGVKKRIIECTQYDIQDELKSLIKYIEKNSKKSN